MTLRQSLIAALFALVLPISAFAQSTCTTLTLGSTGSNVITLQQFFFNTYQNFPTPTGYFGPVTEAALQQWQSEHGVVSGGSPSTTGYGAVGPKTRAAMGLSCAQNISSTVGQNTSSGGVSGITSLVQSLLAQVAVLQAKMAALTAAQNGTAASTVSDRQNNQTVPGTLTVTSAPDTTQASYDSELNQIDALLQQTATEQDPSVADDTTQ